MSRTATCFFALGMCVALAAACGDDDGGDGAGGSGGMGGGGGTSAGSGGSSSGAGGSSGGQGGSAGASGGSAGASGGSAGASGGSAGSSAGTAGAGQAGEGGSSSEDPDAGDGGVTDASTDPVDSGPTIEPDSGVNGNCVGFANPPSPIDPQNNQEVVIARVIFNPDELTATAVLRVVNDFAFGGDQVLCWGATNSECASVDDGAAGERQPGTEVLVEVGSADDPIDVDAGELLFAANTPENVPNVFAYVNWGDHDSAVVDDDGPISTLEEMADDAGFWTVGESIELENGENAFFGQGDTALGSGFDGCTADQFPTP